MGNRPAQFDLVIAARSASLNHEGRWCSLNVVPPTGLVPQSASGGMSALPTSKEILSVILGTRELFGVVSW